VCVCVKEWCFKPLQAGKSKCGVCGSGGAVVVGQQVVCRTQVNVKACGCVG